MAWLSQTTVHILRVNLDPSAGLVPVFLTEKEAEKMTQRGSVVVIVEGGSREALERLLERLAGKVDALLVCDDGRCVFRQPGEIDGVSIPRYMLEFILSMLGGATRSNSSP